MRPLGPWSLAQTAPDEFAAPSDVARASVPWVPAVVPGTVAQALQAAGSWDFDHLQDFDAHDWWYRCSFGLAGGLSGEARLRFEGLATLADVWLNNTLILKADNMFREYRVEVADRLRDHNELAICFRSLATALAKRRPRPQWKTKLVSHQQLRWFRTTLLGRIPGWCPPVAPVGPWRPVSLERPRPGTLSEIDVRSSLDDRAGVVELSCVLHQPTPATVTGDLTVAGASTAIDVARVEHGYRLTGRLRLDHVALWWPHTHGQPTLHPCTAHLVVDGRDSVQDCGRVGFRRVEARRERGRFALDVNGTPVFCRGACWTVSDVVSLRGSRAELARDLGLLQGAGANMIRIGGTMVYEDDAFYQLCDELGILVWQDFMFANMDYPAEDLSFLRSVEAEAADQLRRLRRHPCVAVYCGNSEVEQQAAMLSIPRPAWRNALFSSVLPEICQRWQPDVPYVPSTPSGGDLPFHVGTGVTHYYGVGAYLRPVADVRRASVRFTPECLGFANVPEPDVVDLVMRGERVATGSPRWKERTPRDSGAGWDFEDVRDHYLADLFSLDPVRLRSVDPGRYLELGRVTTGEIMARVFAEWRSAHSTCHGALVWFLKDLWPGAGWGLVDSRGVPKACFHYLRRAWQPRAVVLTDEGLDGLHIHVINETDRVLPATLELTLLRGGYVVVAQATTACELAPRSVSAYGADALLDGFYDVSCAYAFGPPTHDVVAATLYDEARQVVSEAFWIRDARAVAGQAGGAVVAEAEPTGGSSYALALTSERFLFAAHIDIKGFLPDDNYFCLMPGRTREVRLQARPGTREPLSGWVDALNLDRAVPIEMRTPRRLVTS